MANKNFSNKIYRGNENNFSMSNKFAKRTVYVYLENDRENYYEMVIKENKKISDLYEKIYTLNQMKDKTIIFIYCDNICKNISYLKKKIISDVFPDAHTVIKLHVYFDRKNDDFHKKYNYEEDFFNLHDNFYVNSREMKSYSLEEFLFKENKKTDDLLIHPHFYTYRHFYPNTKLISAEDIYISTVNTNQMKNFKYIRMNIKEKEKFEKHLRIIEKITNVNKDLNINLNYDFFDITKENKDLNNNLNYDFFNSNNLNSLADFNKNKEKFIYNRDLLLPRNKIELNQFTITINPYSFEFVKYIYDEAFIKSCELLNIKFIISFSNLLELDPKEENENSSKINIIDDYFKILKRFRARSINLCLVGACFKNRSSSISDKNENNLLEDTIQDHLKKPKEIILSLKINDLRSEFNNVENIEYFYKCLNENSDTKFLEKFTLKNTVIYFPSTLKKLGEIIKSLKLREIKFENIGVRFEINESTYEAITNFYNIILEKNLNRLVFRHFPILDLNFMQMFNDYSCKNYNIIYEFTHSMINRELEVIKYNENKGYYHLQANSCLNYCLNVEKLNLRSLFGSIKSVKLRNFKLRTNMFSIKKSKFFKKLFYKSDFNKNINKFEFNNCSSKEWNIFGDEEYQKEFSLDLKFPHDKLVLKNLFLEKLTYTPLKEDNLNFSLKDINNKFIISESLALNVNSSKNNLIENIPIIFKNLNEIKISKEFEVEYKISPSVRKMSLSDCVMFGGLKKITQETDWEELKLKFSKPLKNYELKSFNLFCSSINHLCLSRYAINLQITENKDILNSIKIDKLTIKHISNKVLENKSIFKILDVSFSKIKRLSIIKCEFKENFKTKPSISLNELSRVDIDFDSLFYFIYNFEGKEKDRKTCEEDVKNFIEFFSELSNKLHPGNIYVDGRTILSQDFFIDFVEKLYKNYEIESKPLKENLKDIIDKKEISKNTLENDKTEGIKNLNENNKKNKNVEVNKK